MTEESVIVTFGGHAFSHRPLWLTAITHRSASRHNYERLEFFGDAVLSLVVSEWLIGYDREATAGTLSSKRASYVCKSHLARCARRLNLGQYLVLGAGEEASGGRDKDSILEGAMEAVIGVVFLQSGLQAARGFVCRNIII